ncbi:MAG: site-specific recombinase [Flavobacterium sp.]|jgi:site-specific recombinase
MHETTAMTSLHDWYIRHFQTEDASDSLAYLVALVALFRPAQPKQAAAVSIHPLLDFLSQETEIAEQVALRVQKTLQKRKFARMLSDSGILKDSDFWYEIKQRAWAKILPYQPEADTLEFVLNQVFYKSTDPIWLAKIPLEEYRALFAHLQLQPLYTSLDDQSPLSELLTAIALLMQRMSGRAMENQVIQMVPEYDDLESPFLALETEFEALHRRLQAQEAPYITPDDMHYRQLLVLQKQCEAYVAKAFQNSTKFGISLKVNQSLLRIRQQLQRVKALLGYLVVPKVADAQSQTILLALRLIRYNCHKNNVRQLFNESTQLLAYEITQHTARTGEHYITETRSEYLLMFKAALGGGFIVGFLCIFKLLLSKVEASAFGHAFLYSFNYAAGFILIYLSGFTLATKQPAMTAATIVQAIENGMRKSRHKDDQKHEAFALLFARLFRSQFIAFFGNVAMAFPVAFGLIWGIDFLWETNIAEDKAYKLLTDLSPIDSLAVFHAAIAGFFLFLSGIISGSISNKNKYNKIAYRIQEHPVLKQTLGTAKTTRLAQWIADFWPGVASNGWFGIFLGSTASLGIFFGLALDIRHITFAAGNFALALYGADFHVAVPMVLWAVIGIGVIGFVNFIVSFSLSLGLALRSRNIPLGELRLLVWATWNYFKRRPIAFFVPVRE